MQGDLPSTPTLLQGSRQKVADVDADDDADVDADDDADDDADVDADDDADDDADVDADDHHLLILSLY